MRRWHLVNSRWACGCVGWCRGPGPSRLRLHLPLFDKIDQALPLVSCHRQQVLFANSCFLSQALHDIGRHTQKLILECVFCGLHQTPLYLARGQRWARRWHDAILRRGTWLTRRAPMLLVLVVLCRAQVLWSVWGKHAASRVDLRQGLGIAHRA